MQNLLLKNNLLASIIIPVYNHAQYLGDAIKSVRHQSYRHFEIIVVDDGSTDNTREVAAQFGDQINYIWQKNQGLSAARNTGIKAAQGAFIGVLDADDIYEPHFLSTLVAILQANPTANGIYCGYQFVDHNNNPMPQIEARQIPPEQMFTALLDGNFLVPESMFVRRGCYEMEGLFDESLRALEDWDMWLRITRTHKIIGTSQVLTRHRILAGSMSTDPTRMLNNRLAVLNKHFGPESMLHKNAASPERRAYGRAYLTSSIERLQAQDQAGAYTCFKNMANVCPDLLTELDTFYQLGCGDQPKGALGDFSSLNIQHNDQLVFGLLDKLYSDPTIANRLKPYRRPAYAKATFALGLLSYGANQLDKTRGYLFRTMATAPSAVLNRRFTSILVKSLLGGRLVNSLKRAKHVTKVAAQVSR